MKIRRVFFVLCPFFLLCIAQEQFSVQHENPYKMGMNIARTYGPEKAHDYFNECHEETGEDMCFYGLAYTWYMMGENHKSVEMVEYMLADAPLPDKFAGHCWALMGANLIYLREFDTAQEPLEKALAYYEKAGHKRNMYRVLVQLGNGNLRAGRLGEADGYFERATFLAISEKVNKGHLYSLRGISAYTQNKTAVALNFAELAFGEHEKSGDRRAMMGTKAYIAFFLYEAGHEEEAKLNILQAREMSQVFAMDLPAWAAWVEAYIHRCERPEHLEQMLKTKMSQEQGFFLNRFVQLAGKKPCP